MPTQGQSQTMSQHQLQQPKRDRKVLSYQERRNIIRLIVEHGFAPKKVSTILKIPRSTVYSVWKVFDRYGRIESNASAPPVHQKITPEIVEDIKNWFYINPTLTNQQVAYCVQAKHSVKVTPSCISKFLDREGYSLKVVHEIVTTKNYEELLEKRRIWALDFDSYKPPVSKLIYIDEAGFNIALHSNKGKSLVGTRAFFKMKQRLAPNYSLAMAISVDGLIHYESKLGGYNGDSFAEFISHLFDCLDARLPTPPQPILEINWESIQQPLEDEDAMIVPENQEEVEEEASSSQSSSSTYAPSIEDLLRDEEEELKNNTNLLFPSEEMPGQSFPMDQHYKAWIVMDNARIHKVSQVRRLFAERGYAMIFIPPYSPKLNPIESAFSKLKTHFRNNNIGYVDSAETPNRIRDACNTLTADDCKGFINASEHCFPLCIGKQNLPN